MKLEFKIIPQQKSFHKDDVSFLPITNILHFSHYHVLFVSLISLFVLFFPKFWVIVIMPLTIISLVFSVLPLYIEPYFENKLNIVKPLLEVLKEIHLLEFLSKLHLAVFYTEMRIYYYFRNVCYGLTIVHMLTSRYNFYHITVLHDKFSVGFTTLIGLILFISFCGSYVRTLINISNLVIVVARRYTPDLLDPLLHVDPPDLPPPSTSTPPPKFVSIFSRNVHHHNHPPMPPQPKATNWGRIGFFVGVGGLCISGVTLYHVQRQTFEMERQTFEMERQTFEMERQTLDLERQTFELERQNDLSEIELALLTKEEYKKKYQKRS